MKVTKFLPIALLAITGLVACGPTADPTETPAESTTEKPAESTTTDQATPDVPVELPDLAGPVTLKVWATPAEEPVLNKVVEAHNKAHADAKITIDYKPVNEGECATQVLKNPNGDKAPDLFLVADDQIFNLQKAKALTPIAGLYGKTVKENNSEAAVTGATYNDTLYGFPVTNDNGYFTWFDNSAVTAEDVASFEGLLEKASTLKKKVLLNVKDGWYVPTFLMSPDACGVDSLRWSADANQKVSYTTNWDNEVGVKVCEHITTVVKKYYDAGTLIVGDDGVIKQQFKDGNLIAAVTGLWNEKPLSGILGDKLGATTLPSYHIDGKAYQMASFTGSKVYCVNNFKTQDQKKAAIFLAEVLTNKESQLIRFEERATLPCNKEAAADPRYAEHVSMGGKALLAQTSKAGIVQSLTAEKRYWDVGAAIGTAYTTGDLGDYANWKEFLTAKCDGLRTAL